MAFLLYGLRDEEYCEVNFFDYYDSDKREEFEKKKEAQRRKEIEEFKANPPRGHSAVPPLVRTLAEGCNDN